MMSWRFLRSWNRDGALALAHAVGAVLRCTVSSARSRGEGRAEELHRGTEAVDRFAQHVLVAERQQRPVRGKRARQPRLDVLVPGAVAVDAAGQEQPQEGAELPRE